MKDVVSVGRRINAADVSTLTVILLAWKLGIRE